MIIVLFDDWFIEPSGLLELIFLHEEHMSHVEFPGIMFIAELHRLSKDLLDLCIVLQVPVYLGLLHQYRNVSRI